MTSIKNDLEIIQQTENFVRERFKNEGSGHDWWHIHRVRNMAVFLAENEGGNTFIIELAALLHDLEDWKLSNSKQGETKKWLESIGLANEKIKYIIEIIEQVSFKGAGVETKAMSIEAKIVQDADRLDAIGAIGIARTFAYGGNKNRLIHDPQVKPQMHDSFSSYKNGDAPTINHFYEKLLLLKERMNTATAKKIAKHRHQVMVNFLKEFFSEWNLETN